MSGLSIRKGDKVAVTAGKDRGKRGKVLFTLPDKDKVVIEGVAMIKRHSRPTRKVPQGGVMEREAPIHVSNVQVICPSCNLPTRVGKRETPQGVRIRICRKCGGDIDKA